MVAVKDREIVEAQSAQREGAKRATLEALRGKKRAEKTLAFRLNEGEEPLTMVFRAIGTLAWEELLTLYPPTTAQIADGAAYNPDKFQPALLHRVCVDPVLSEPEWKEILDSPDWGRGEAQGLFWEAVNLCNKGLDFTPFVAG